jgi:pimeloyl-ACP methyl ester carboxylesterase
MRVNLFNPLPRDNSNLPWLIYLPGMDGTGKLFHTQIPRLTPYFNLRCLSIPPTDVSNWEKLTQTTIECLKAELSKNNLKWVYLCGESFGGCLAMSVAIANPESIGGLILVNPASSFNQQPLLSLGINLTRLIPEWLHRNSAVGLLPFLADLSRIAQKDRKALLLAMQSLPQQVVSWRLSMLRDFAILPSQWQNFKPPILVIAGGCDRLLPSIAEAKNLVNVVPKGVMEILPNSGHACLLETKTDLASILAKHQFLKK